MRQHRNGKLWVWVTNWGQIGGSHAYGGALFPGTEQETAHSYINDGGIMLGGIIPANGIINQVGMMDTLVSEGFTMWIVTDSRELQSHWDVDHVEEGKIKVRSTLQSSEFYSPDAVSPEDFI
ncbi:hypothetical protein ACFL4Q_03430, partial [candidate division KSB1 bacterium]